MYGAKCCSKCLTKFTAVSGSFNKRKYFLKILSTHMCSGKDKCGFKKKHQMQRLLPNLFFHLNFKHPSVISYNSKRNAPTGSGPFAP